MCAGSLDSSVVPESFRTCRAAKESPCLRSCWFVVSTHRTPRRADLAQHFLRSRALAASLIAQAPVERSDLVVEIGPGRGILTRELARRCRKVVAVEFDGVLSEALRTSFQSDDRVTIVTADILRFRLPNVPYKVLGNIPFNRTAAIVRRLAQADAPPQDAYIVVQREAAERFAGGPFSRETLSSLLLKPWWQVEIARRFRRTDFDPPPSVDAVALWLARRTRPLVERSQAADYRRFIRTCFGRDGHSIRRCLRSQFTRTQIHRLSRDLRFDPSGPASSLTFDQWLGLFRFRMLRPDSG
ncbi:MAG: 23S ribosomal RNA methyltransferase Erm [Gemmatimonadetes bacterium]|nr:23S ribosomal RNA methyltransferase Erm [Gemmatimonadota bacterium]MYE93082.1 23S ribosomal RNA methyltransferase Erm [Gemmatimonadota bacterium]MYJ10109.1 23S ribosomal RNA methyltransferase Erm [Gemmatimonadota bacterium]